MSVILIAEVESLPLMVAGWTVVGAIVLVTLLNLRTTMLRMRAVREVRDREVELLREQIHSVREQRRVYEERREGWQGFANFVVARKQLHGDSGICSFYLRPQNSRLKLPKFFPGQHLVFQVPSENGGAPLKRRYSLSDAPGKDHYRISVKLALPPADEPQAPVGRGSSYFHRQLMDESEDSGRCHLLVAAPQGSFFLHPAESEPLVLVGGGVGLTPVLSMLNAILEQNPDREVWFFYGVRNSDEDILFDPGVLHPDFASLSQDRSSLQMRIRYSRPLERDASLFDSRPDLYSEGRVTIEYLREELPGSNFQYYICGPDAMMDQLERGLEDWGVPGEKVHSERFGPPPDISRVVDPSVGGTIHFSRSGREMEFAVEDSCLLDTAERAGVPISNDCRSGSCGECRTAIESGEVSYPRKPSYRCPPGYCLTCSCVPKGDVVLDC